MWGMFMGQGNRELVDVGSRLRALKIKDKCQCGQLIGEMYRQKIAAKVWVANALLKEQKANAT